MSRRTTALAAALSLLALGSPFMTGCGAQTTIAEWVSNQVAESDSAERRALKDEIAELTKLIETNPQDAAAYFNRGNAKSDLKDYQGAISDYTKAIEINPQYAANYNNRGLAKIDLKDYKGAVADYTKAIAINPQYAYYYMNRGITRENIGDLKGACADWRKASSLGEKDAAGWVREQCQ